MTNQADTQTRLALLDAGIALFNQKQYDDAFEKYKRAAELDPNYARTFYIWGLGLTIRNKYDDAIEKYKRATELDTNYASAFDNWGVALAAQKKYDEAIEKYKRATELDPNYAFAFNNWGLALDAQKQYGKVIDKYREAIKANPNSVDSIYAAHNVADFLQRQGKYKESWEAWEKARQAYEKYAQDKDLNDAECFLNYGNMLSDPLGKLSEAEKIYRRGLVYNDNHSGIWFGLVNLHLAKMEDNGEESVKETRLLWPFGKGAREGQALESDVQKSDNYWRAREAYIKAELILQKRRREAKDVRVLLRLGELYLKVEDYTAAELILFEVMNEDQESPQSYADLGVLYSRKGDYSRAVQYFEQALQKDIDDLTVRSNLAEACLKANLVERSEAEYKKILGVTPLHVESHIGLGEVYTAMGDAGDGDMYDEAVTCFDREVGLRFQKAQEKDLLRGALFSRLCQGKALRSFKKTK
jgi:protein O-mannosyl-transferase